MRALSTKHYNELIDKSNEIRSVHFDHIQTMMRIDQQQRLTISRQDDQIKKLTRQVVDLQAAAVEMKYIREENKNLLFGLLYYKGLVDIFQDIIRGENHAVGGRLEAGTASERDSTDSGNGDRRCSRETASHLDAATRDRDTSPGTGNRKGRTRRTVLAPRRSRKVTESQ